MQKKILIIDDEHAILELLKLNLEIYNYDVFTMDTGAGVIEEIIRIQPDILLLDLMLPEIDGFQLCQSIRKNPVFHELRILIISAKSEEIDKIHCLEMGADDYITKPFSIKELIARINAFSRRMINPPAGKKIVSYKNIKIDVNKKILYKNNLQLSLTSLELKLFLYLLKNQGMVTTRSMIFKDVWNYEDENNTRSLDVNIRKLRKKLGDENNNYIETIRGIGYKLS